MKRETISLAFNGLEDTFISEAAEFCPEVIEESPERIVHMKKKRIFSVALAAALILALGIGAYAAYSAFSARVPEPEEAFRIRWEENVSGYIEWTDAKLAVTFPETAESRQIEFRPGWLPEELASLRSEEWLDRLTAEQLADKYPGMTGNQPLLIESYSMSQFNNGGALLLLYFTPEEIVEEHWDEQGVDVMRFHAAQHFDAHPEHNAPEYTVEQDIILMSNPEAGWVVRVCGEAGMDTLLKVAKNLEIRETGRTLSYDDFENHFAFMDGGVG